MVKRFVRFKTVKEAIGLAKSSIYEQIASGEFPKPIPLGKRSVGWLEDEVAAWQQARIALREASSPKEAALRHAGEERKPPGRAPRAALQRCQHAS